MKRLGTLFPIAAAAVSAAAIAAWLVAAPRPAFDSSMAAALEKPGDAERGRVVFEASGCSPCHASPGQKDRERLGGGLALTSMFGTFHVPNISPDPKDGIGNWRTIDLANALLSGVSPDRRHYYPALPYVDYARMSMEDVRDLMAYLRTLPPVPGRPPPHELSFPLSIRRLVGLWKLLYFHPAPVPAEPARGPDWTRGRYLVEVLGHCAECHAARDMLGGIRPQTRFAGGPDQENVGFVPNITPASIGHWTDAELERALSFGLRPDNRPIGSTMASIVTDIAALPERDRRAIVAFLRSLPPRPTPPP